MLAYKQIKTYHTIQLDEGLQLSGLKDEWSSA